MVCGSTCTATLWLIVRPSAAGKPACGAPLPQRAPGLGFEAPADLAGRAHPGPDQAWVWKTGSASKMRSLGRACQHAAVRPAPVVPVGARVAFDLAADHRWDRPSILAMRAWHSPDPSPARATARPRTLKSRRQPIPNLSQPGNRLTPYDTTHTFQRIPRVATTSIARPVRGADRTVALRTGLKSTTTITASGPHRIDARAKNCAHSRHR